jgi:hypothetical protein
MKIFLSAKQMHAMMMTMHFIYLTSMECYSGHERRRIVKEFTLKKMTEAFQNYKKMLYTNFS